jgi:hypothetical protein
MDYIVEVMTTGGKICEQFRSYARARRRIDQLPAETIVGVPLIFAILPDGSQRLVREDGKPLQWHRLAEDGSVITDEPLPLTEEPDDPNWTGPLIRPIFREPAPDDEDDRPRRRR